MLADIITNSDYYYNKDNWKMKKREQLRNAYIMIDEAVEEIKSNPQFFKLYLDVQSRFDRYTIRNALLLAKQFPEARQLKDYNTWKELNVFFKNKYPNKIIILEPGDQYVNKDGRKVTPYNAKEMIDVSETNLKPSVKNYDKQLVLQALIHKNGTKIVPVENLENGQMYNWDKEQNIIYICKTDDFDTAISSLASAIAKVNLYDEVGEISEEKAECISYMVCKKYNVGMSIDNIEKLTGMFASKDNKQIKDELSAMKNILYNINSRMEQYLDKMVRNSKNKDIER